MSSVNCGKLSVQNQRSLSQNKNQKSLLRRNIRALLHQRAYGEPKGVHECELVFQDVWFAVTWVRVVPFVRAEPATTKQRRITIGHLLRQKIATLLHQRPDRVPHAIQQGELVLQVFRIRIARVRILPLVRGEPAQPNILYEINLVNISWFQFGFFFWLPG